MLFISVAVTLGVMCAGPMDGQGIVSSIPGTGNFLSLSSGTPPPLTNLNISISNAGPGATAAGQPASPPPGNTPFINSATMGDLALVSNGMAAEVILGLRIRGNVGYQVLMTQAFYTATNLQYHGANISGNTDRGSFIRVFVGTPVPVGPLSNVQSSALNPALAGTGLLLNQVAFGTVTPGFGTLVIQGPSPTVTTTTSTTPSPVGLPSMLPTAMTTSGSKGVAGTGNATTALGGREAGMPTSTIVNPFGANPTAVNATTTDSAIDVPLIFVMPTGLELGPVTGPSPGSFNTQMQFAIFPKA